MDGPPGVDELPNSGFAGWPKAGFEKGEDEVVLSAAAPKADLAGVVDAADPKAEGVELDPLLPNPANPPPPPAADGVDGCPKAD